MSKPTLAFLSGGGAARWCATTHPRALGRPGVECWGEVRPLVGPMLERVLDEGKPFTADDLQLMVWRDGYFEACFFYFSYGPIYEEDGSVSGAFCPSSRRPTRSSARAGSRRCASWRRCGGPRASRKRAGRRSRSCRGTRSAPRSTR
jgi:hypothetical protein